MRSLAIFCAVSVFVAGALPAGAQSMIRDLAPDEYAGGTRLILTTTSDEARAAFDAGLEAQLELDGATALAEYRRAYELDPGLHLARAMELSLMGRAPRIGEEIDRLARRTDSSGLIESMLFIWLRELHLGRTVPARTILNAIVRAAPTDGRLAAFYHFGLSAGNATRIGLARIQRDRDPNRYIGHAYVANAITAAGDTAEALEAMREALRLGPNEPYAHYAAGRLLTRLRRHDEAATHYGHALRIDPDYLQAAFARAQVLLYAGRYEEARRDMETLAQRAVYAPRRAAARRAIAITYLREADIERATSEMEAVARQFVAEGNWHTQIGYAHDALGLMAAARKDEQAVERHVTEIAKYYHPGFAAAVTSITWSLAGRPDRSRAAADEFEVLVEGGEYAASAGLRANVRAAPLIAEGSHAEAIQVLGTASNHVALLLGYQALTGLGRHEEARQRLERLLGASGYGINAIFPPLARYMYARTGV